MKNLLKYLSFIILIFLFSSCKKENWCDCVKGTGENIEEIRNLSSFNAILINDKIEVHLIKGSIYQVKVVAGSNVISLIKTEVENGRLKISDANKCDFTRSYKRKVVAYITLPDIVKIEHDGTGEMFMNDQFSCDTFRYYLSNSGNLNLNLNANTVYGGMHGIGDVNLKGKIKSNFIYASGQGFYNSNEAISNEMILTLNTSGKMEVQVVDFLKVDMLAASTGNVYFKGNPATITTTIQGKGKLIHQ